MRPELIPLCECLVTTDRSKDQSKEFYVGAALATAFLAVVVIAIGMALYKRTQGTLKENVRYALT